MRVISPPPHPAAAGGCARKGVLTSLTARMFSSNTILEHKLKAPCLHHTNTPCHTPLHTGALYDSHLVIDGACAAVLPSLPYLIQTRIVPFPSCALGALYDSHLVIDARLRSNVARFVNHSCAPNCLVQTVMAGCCRCVCACVVWLCALRMVLVLEKATPCSPICLGRRSWRAAADGRCRCYLSLLQSALPYVDFQRTALWVAIANRSNTHVILTHRSHIMYYAAIVTAEAVPAGTELTYNCKLHTRTLAALHVIASGCLPAGYCLRGLNCSYTHIHTHPTHRSLRERRGRAQGRGLRRQQPALPLWGP